MDNLIFTEKAKETFEKFLSFWPLISRGLYKEKTHKALEYLLFKNNEHEVTKDIIIKALQDTFPSFETFILTLKDPTKLSGIIKLQKDIDKHNPIIKITRWDLPEITIKKPVRDVFAFLASPRIGGNTDCILDSLLEGAKESGCKVEKLSFSKLNIKPCMGCLECEKRKGETFCAIKDDMTYIYKRLQECDAFVLGFPIYTARESCHTTIFFDRLKALSDPWEHKKIELKKGALVVTWGWPSEKTYQNVVHTIAFLLRHFGVEISEVVAGCGFWDAYYQKGIARLDASGLKEAQKAGRALVSQ